MMTFTENRWSAEDKRRSWTITIVVHALIFLLCLLPFMAKHAQESNMIRAIQIRFDEPSARESGSAAAASSESAPAQQTEQVREVREMMSLASVERITTSTALPTPAREIQVTEVQPQIFLPSSPQSSSASDRFFEQPLNVIEQDAEVVKAFEARPDPSRQQAVTWHVADREASDRSAPESFDLGRSGSAGSGTSSASGTRGNAPRGAVEDGAHNPFADGSFPEGTGRGRGDRGGATGAGDDGKGMHWGDFAGDGLFNRKVIRRADVARIATIEGRVVVNLCVDPLGKVVLAKYDAPNSTIRDQALLLKAQECASQYIFDQDPSAPRQQCGKLTFIFKIDK